MKKISTFLLVFFLMIGLSACGSNEKIETITPSDVVAKRENKESFLLVASSTTCSYCQSYKEELEAFKKQDSDANVIVVEIDQIDSYEDRADFINLYSVNATPTSFFIKDGEIVNTETGVIPSDELAKLYQENLN